MDYSHSGIVPISVEEFKTIKHPIQRDYAALFKRIMLEVSEIYFKTPSEKFSAAVEGWAWHLGGNRELYTPNQPNREPESYDSERHCYLMWMELEASQTKAAIKARGQDPSHQPIFRKAEVYWKSLKQVEQDALHYATLRICMRHPSLGGFGDEARWTKDLRSGALPPLRTAPWKDSASGRVEAFLQKARDLHEEYEDKLFSSLKTDPRDPFGDRAKQRNASAPKTKPEKNIVRNADEPGAQSPSYFPDDLQATETTKKQEPQGGRTLPQFTSKTKTPADVKGPEKK